MLVGVPVMTAGGFALTVNTINAGTTVRVLAGVMNEVVLPEEFVTVSVGYHVPGP
jgi:hypothetical protein